VAKTEQTQTQTEHFDHVCEMLQNYRDKDSITTEETASAIMWAIAHHADAPRADAELARLRKSSAELVAACERYLDAHAAQFFDDPVPSRRCECGSCVQARAALAHATEGESRGVTLHVSAVECANLLTGDIDEETGHTTLADCHTWTDADAKQYPLALRQIGNDDVPVVSEGHLYFVDLAEAGPLLA
jgi:hypothetical protein